MPRRKGIIFGPRDVGSVRLIKPVRLGSTITSGRVFYGKIFLKPENFSEGTRRAQRVFLKPAGEHVTKELALRNRLRALGLPVPKAGIVIVQTKDGPQEFLAIEAFLRRGGMRSKLKPINPATRLKPFGKNPGKLEPNPEPRFLKKLSLVRNRSLIEQIAKDTAAIIRAGIGIRAFDQYGFYRGSDGSWKRIIMDIGGLYELPRETPRAFDIAQRAAFLGVLSKISAVWPITSKHFKAFRKAFMEALPAELVKQYPTVFSGNGN